MMLAETARAVLLLETRMVAHSWRRTLMKHSALQLRSLVTRLSHVSPSLRRMHMPAGLPNFKGNEHGKHLRG